MGKNGSAVKKAAVEPQYTPLDDEDF